MMEIASNGHLVQVMTSLCHGKGVKTGCALLDTDTATDAEKLGDESDLVVRLDFYA
jgi:hypothetical protein